MFSGMNALIAPLLCAGALASSTFAQAQDLPAALQSVPAGYSNVVYFGDILPVIEAVLGDEQFAAAMEGTGMSARELKQQLRFVQGYVPSRVVVAASDEGVAMVGHVLRGLVGFQLLMGAQVTGASDEVATFQKEMLPALDGLLATGLHLGLEARDPRVAESWFESVADMFVGLEMQTEWLTVTQEGDTVDAVFQPDRDEVGYALAMVGVATDATDPFVTTVADRLKKSPLRLRVSLDGAALTFRMGAASGSLAAAEVAPSWKDDALMFGQWHAEGFRASALAATELWSRWKDSEIGAWVIEGDVDDFTGTIEDLGWQVEQLPVRGSFRGEVGDRAFDIVMEEEVTGYDALARTGIGSFVPDVPLLVTGGDRFGDRLAGTLRQIEDRLAMRELQAGLDPDSPAAELSRLYYDRLANTRSAILEETREWFGEGWALLGTMAGTLRIAPPAGAFGGGGETSPPLPCPELAFVARIGGRAGGAGDKTPADYVDTLFDAIAKDAGVESKATRKDLGLGAPTRVVPASLWEDAVRIDGDMVFHAFPLDDVVVISTSPRLSRAILAARQGEGRDFAADVVMEAQLSGDYVTGFVEAIGAWTSLGGNDIDSELQMIQDVIGLSKGFGFRSTKQEGGRIRTEGSLRF